MSDERNIAQRHRFDPDYTGPLTFRDFMRDTNWLVLALIVALAGFWLWVGYRIAQWWPW
jgi:hypothetical protein